MICHRLLSFLVLFSVQYDGGNCLENAIGTGILISGGTGPEDPNRSVEVVVPATGQFCSFPDHPDDYRYYHTMDSLYICGGKRSNCLHFFEGEWSLYFEMEDSFEGHSSWETDLGILLLGGAIWGRSSKFVPTNGEESGPSIELAHKSRYACAMPDLTSDSAILTGGSVGESYVARYDLNGFVEALPSMLVARQHHGCGSYLRPDGTQVYMVAGGNARNGFDYSLTASTEMLTSGADTWVLATPLPTARSGLKGVSVDNRVYMTGGGSYTDEDDSDIVYDDILEWQDEEQAWAAKYTSMQYSRENHAVTRIHMDNPAMQYCTGHLQAD